jgi:hypothetical protein
VKLRLAALACVDRPNPAIAAIAMAGASVRDRVNAGFLNMIPPVSVGDVS